MNYKEAQILVKQPKWVVEESGDIVKTLTMEQRFPMRFRLRLVCALDPNKAFLLDVKQSEKFGVRLNFQMMDSSNWGLARFPIVTTCSS